MKAILASLLTVGTVGASYTAYKSPQFAPLVSRIEAALPGSAPTETTGSFTETGTAYRPNYTVQLFPYLQAAVAPLELHRGKLSEEQLLRIREIFLHERERAEAREAIELLDRILVVLRDRENFRRRFEIGEGNNIEFFRDRLAKEWHDRALILGEPLRRGYGSLWEHEEKVRVAIEQNRRPAGGTVRVDPHGRLPYDEHHGSFGDSGFRIGEHHEPLLPITTAGPAHREPLIENKNPLERHEPHLPLADSNYRNPLEHREPLGEYHNPLETNTRSNIGSTANVNEGTHPTTTSTNPLERRPQPVNVQNHAAGTGVQAHSGTTTTTAPARTVVRPAPVVIAPVATGGA